MELPRKQVAMSLEFRRAKPGVGETNKGVVSWLASEDVRPSESACSPVVKTALSCQGAQVPSLVRELRSCMPRGLANNSNNNFFLIFFFQE